MNKETQSEFSFMSDIRTQAVELQARYVVKNKILPHYDTYWFPHQKEVRLILVDDDKYGSSKSSKTDNPIIPMGVLYGPRPDDNLIFPVKQEHIDKSEFRVFDLPTGWGNWEDGVLLEKTHE